MKDFQTYFYEANKLFEFRVKIADIEPRGPVMEAIKLALDAYQIETISKVKRMPIQNHRDFPKNGPCECYMFDVAVRYPTIVEQIRQLIVERARIPGASVCVYTKAQMEQEEALSDDITDDKESILEQPELKAESAQDAVGEKRLTSFLKELETTKHEIAGKEKSDGKTTNELEQGTISPVGSTKITKPEPKSSAR
jgi:hypothetical protein